MIGLIGRTRELGLLRDRLDHVAHGHGEVVLVVGEAGIGKTRLAAEVATEAAARGMRVVWGRCWEGGGAPAYWPWRRVMKALGYELPAPSTAGSDVEHERFALFEGVMDQLAASARDVPLWIVLDDLHVADHSSLQLLQFVARAIREVQVGIGVLGTYRDRQAGELLGKLEREATCVMLKRFDSDEIAAFAKTAGSPLSDATLAEVARVTEGNPLFVEQVIRGLPNLTIPHGLRAALREQLGLVVDREARRLLEIAAVVGRDARVAIVAKAAGISARDAAARLAPAIASGLVQINDDTIRFGHVLLRDEVYASLAADVRMALHAAVAEATSDPDEIAHHSLAAIGVVGIERAIRAALEAARRYMAMLAFEDAALLLARTLDALPASVESVVVCDLETERGLALSRAGLIAAGKQACVRAAQLARGAGDAKRFALAALAHGAELVPGVVDRTLVELLEEASRMLPAAERALRARVLARLAAAMQPSMDPFVPLAMARDAIALARTLDDADRRAVLFAASSALADRGAPDECVALDTEFGELARRAGDSVQVLRSEARLVFGCLEAGDIASADAHIDTYALLAADFRELRYRWPALLMRAMRELLAGRHDEVERLHAEARALAGDAPDQLLSIVLANQRFFMVGDVGSLGEAEASIRDAMTLIKHSPIAALLRRVFFARLHARAGSRDATLENVRALRQIGIVLEDPVIAKLVAESYALVGERSEVERLYNTLLPRAAGMVSLGMTAMVIDGPVARLLGLLANALGNREIAARHFAVAIERLEALGSPTWLARVRREAGAAPAPAPPNPRGFTIRREGDVYRVETGVNVALLKDSHGMRLLAQLIEHPGREFHVLAFGADAGDAGEMLDATAIASYRERVESLQHEIDQAEAFSDLGRAEQKRAELAALAAELSRGVGIGGRSRRAAAAAERARVNVQRHLRKAIRAIGEHLPELSRHLDRSVRTGTYCRYDPA